jgi:glyoxylate reductase
MPSPKIYVTRRIPEEALSLLRGCGEVNLWESNEIVPRQVLLRKVREADALFCLVTEQIDEELLVQAPRLKMVALMAVGYDNVDVPALTRREVLLTNTPGVLTETTADLTFALILAVARRVAEAEHFVREGKWRFWEPLLLAGRDVHHATLGIIGLGRIGAEVAKRARGFDMRVLYTSRTRKRETEEALGCLSIDLSTLLQESDFVTVHVPLTPETHHLLSMPQFRLMKPTAYLINVARGPVIDQRALYVALRDGLIAGAALDVTNPEPIPAGDRLLSLQNCLILPHIGSASIATRTRMATLAAENILAFLQGRRPPTPVNPEVLEKQ